MDTELYNNYLRRIQQNIKADPKSFWDYINLKNSNTNTPKFLKFNNELADNNDDIANHFAKFFQTVYATSNNNFDHMEFFNGINEGTDTETHISKDEIIHDLIILIRKREKEWIAFHRFF